MCLSPWGSRRKALALKQRSHELDPFIPVRNNNLAAAPWLDGQTDAAIALLKDSIGRVGRPGIGAETDLARIYASLGRYQDAADTLSLILTSPRTLPQQVRENISTAVGLLHSAPAKAANPEKLSRLSGVHGFICTLARLSAPWRAMTNPRSTSPLLASHPSILLVCAQNRAVQEDHARRRARRLLARSRLARIL
jgi:hypothetical protein